MPADHRLDLNLFCVFDAVYVHGGIGAAARALHLTQPAVTHALNRLRARLPIAVRPLPLRLKPFPLLAYWHESRDTDRAHQWVRERIAALVRSSAGIADA